MARARPSGGPSLRRGGAVIFVTVGTQGPFDRLVRTVDEWAGRSGQDVFAQTGPSDFRPRHIRGKSFIGPEEFRHGIETATLVVAHAGMGTILTALEFGKKVVVMPRLCAMGEQRNDHQLATARRFSERGLVIAAFDEAELRATLECVGSPVTTDPISTQASASLIAALRDFVLDGKRPAFRATP